MSQTRHSPDEIIQNLRRPEVAIAQGSTVAEARKSIGVTEHTCYRWRSGYGGLRFGR